MRVGPRPRRAAAAALCVALAASVAVCPETRLGVRAEKLVERLRPQQAAASLTSQAAAFLATYVRPDGRVSRPDQGNDTVSEGQAYGMLLAEATGNDRVFSRIWQWTRVHLQRDDGLFAWRAGPDGRIWGSDAASDADLLIAWALLRYQGSGAGALHRSGQQVADGILAHEVVTSDDGTPVLTAGSWATTGPATLDPSYWSLAALTDLARLTGDAVWQRLAESSVRLTAQLTQGGRRLPPDWAQLTPDGGSVPVAGPPGWPSGGKYGLDAERTVVWFAGSCDPQARALAARWWRVLEEPGRSQALALNLDGTVLDPTRAVLPLVAAAAAARAAHADATSTRLLSLAHEQQRDNPGYYGAAWSAFGPLLVQSGVLGGC